MKNTHNNAERGNVLFLILIAVALFAALSYAVTQSSRSGGGSTDRETSILSGASMTQYPAGLRTSVVRMILSGTDVTEIQFDAPDAILAANEGASVFHPRGGGALFQEAPANLMANNQAGTWFFNGNWDVPGIGLSDSADGNDLIAFLPGISRGVCTAVNEELNFVEDITDCFNTDGAVPHINTTLTQANIRENIQIDTGGVTFPTTDQEDLANATSACTAFIGHPAGCFFDAGTNGGEYVYYAVLLER